MKFKTKRDSFFTYIWLSVILLINVVFILPIVFDRPSSGELTALIIIDLAVTALLLWLAIDISYEIEEDHFLVKGGLFRSKIRYSDISRISKKPNLWMGYRLISSREAIEIYYRTGLLESVVISPENPDDLIAELMKKNRSIVIQD